MGDLTAERARLSSDLGVRSRGAGCFCGYSLMEKTALVIGPRGDAGRCLRFSGGRTVAATRRREMRGRRRVAYFLATTVISRARSPYPRPVI